MPTPQQLLADVIAASTSWLLTAYPPLGGAFSRALAEAQAYQAVALAAALAYPDPFDAALLEVLAPSGSARLDALTGSGAPPEPWRTWVDERIVSWAAVLLTDAYLAVVAAERAGVSADRLITPDPDALSAAALLRHPDLTAAVAALHSDALLTLLDVPRH